MTHSQKVHPAITKAQREIDKCWPCDVAAILERELKYSELIGIAEEFAEVLDIVKEGDEARINPGAAKHIRSILSTLEHKDGL